MSLEEPRILSNDVHNVGCHYGFVVFSPLRLAKTQKFFDDSHQESFLRILICNKYWKNYRLDIIQSKGLLIKIYIYSSRRI